jgi:hypothetical protein
VPDQPTNVVYSCAYSAQANGGRGKFVGAVQAAIAQLKRERPNIFVGDAIKLPNHYFDGVVQILASQYGLCAMRKAAGPGNEIGVKSSDRFSEQYDIFAGGKNGLYYPVWSYTATCSPAAF